MDKLILPIYGKRACCNKALQTVKGTEMETLSISVPF